MRLNRNWKLLIATSLLASRAADATAIEGFEGCKGIDDDTARLACYDRIAGRNPADTTAAAVAMPATQANAAVVSSAAVPAAAAPGATAGAQGAQDFGLSEADKKARDPAKYRESVPESITRAVRTVSTDGYDRFVVTLDGGQVWAQVEMESGTRAPRVGDVVTISSAALGSYKLHSERTRSTRVRRVK